MIIPPKQPTKQNPSGMKNFDEYSGSWTSIFCVADVSYIPFSMNRLNGNISRIKIKMFSKESNHLSLRSIR